MDELSTCVVYLYVCGRVVGL